MTTDTRLNFWRVGRLEIGYRRFIHHYSTGVGDRWVFQPYVIWDLK